jgi:hypothetical protein
LYLTLTFLDTEKHDLSFDVDSKISNISTDSSSIMESDIKDSTSFSQQLYSSLEKMEVFNSELSNLFQKSTESIQIQIIKAVIII